MKKNTLFIAFHILLAAVISSCSEEKAVSVSPELGTLTIESKTLYTGQNANVNVSYKNLGEHVYFSSSAHFTYTMTGNNGYSRTDSVLVANVGVTPTPFTFKMILPESPGSYTLTLRTPYINKSAGTSTEGESIIFNSLTARTNFNVVQADALDANFGDSRETLSEALNVTDCIIQGVSFGSGVAFDPAGKTSGRTDYGGFVNERLYKFSNNQLVEVEEISKDTLSVRKFDENGNAINESIRNTADITHIMKKAKEFFTLSTQQWEREEIRITPNNDEYTTQFQRIISDADANNWKDFLNKLIFQEIESYTHIYKMYADDDETVRTYCVVSIYQQGASICLSRRYVKNI